MSDNRTSAAIRANYMSNKEFFRYISPKEHDITGKTSYVVLAIFILLYWVSPLEAGTFLLGFGAFLALFTLALKFSIFHFPVALGFKGFGQSSYELELLRERITFTQKMMVSLGQMAVSSWWIILLFGVVKSFVMDIYIIPSESMMPNLNVGNVVYVNKLNRGDVKNGDVIVFDHHVGNQLFPVPYIKRVIASGGDTIEIDGNRVTVNRKSFENHVTGKEAITIRGQQFATNKVLTVNQDIGKFEIFLTPSAPQSFPLNEEAFYGKEHCQLGTNYIKCSIPAEHYFVMGDNRQFSQDSRYWGLLKASDVTGIKFK